MDSERLAVHVRSKLGSSRLVAISNREPYFHARRGRNLEVVVPASGLVTAMEPVLLACEGTWIAHGCGDADRETVDHNDRLRVPPDDPRYTLRRVWLTPGRGGRATTTVLPMKGSGRSATSPTPVRCFARRTGAVPEVNRKFADAALEEMQDASSLSSLVQDYHFALLPRMIKEARPDARVAIFWHIPWPNPEAFGICPWQRELLDGLLGADLIGFHVQSHCNNFLETVDRALESRVDWEQFAVNRHGHTTLVRPFPISVDFAEFEAPGTPRRVSLTRSARARICGATGRRGHLHGSRRRSRGLHEGHPRALPRHRTVPRTVRAFQRAVHLRADRRAQPDRTSSATTDLLDAVSKRKPTASIAGSRRRLWKPIVLPASGTTPTRRSQRYYRAADLCLVTSLHDGMNLVAKEFVAARTTKTEC